MWSDGTLKLLVGPVMRACQEAHHHYQLALERTLTFLVTHRHRLSRVAPHSGPHSSIRPCSVDVSCFLSTSIPVAMARETASQPGPSRTQPSQPSSSRNGSTSTRATAMTNEEDQDDPSAAARKLRRQRRREEQAYKVSGWENLYGGGGRPPVFDIRDLRRSERNAPSNSQFNGSASARHDSHSPRRSSRLPPASAPQPSTSAPTQSRSGKRKATSPPTETRRERRRTRSTSTQQPPAAQSDSDNDFEVVGWTGPAASQSRTQPERTMPVATKLEQSPAKSPQTLPHVQNRDRLFLTSSSSSPGRQVSLPPAESAPTAASSRETSLSTSTRAASNMESEDTIIAAFAQGSSLIEQVLRAITRYSESLDQAHRHRETADTLYRQLTALGPTPTIKDLHVITCSVPWRLDKRLAVVFRAWNTHLLQRHSITKRTESPSTHAAQPVRSSRSTSKEASLAPAAVAEDDAVAPSNDISRSKTPHPPPATIETSDAQADVQEPSDPTDVQMGQIGASGDAAAGQEEVDLLADHEAGDTSAGPPASIASVDSPRAYGTPPEEPEEQEEQDELLEEVDDLEDDDAVPGASGEQDGAPAQPVDAREPSVPADQEAKEPVAEQASADAAASMTTEAAPVPTGEPSADLAEENQEPIPDDSTTSTLVTEGEPQTEAAAAKGADAADGDVVMDATEEIRASSAQPTAESPPASDERQDGSSTPVPARSVDPADIEMAADSPTAPIANPSRVPDEVQSSTTETAPSRRDDTHEVTPTPGIPPADHPTADATGEAAPLPATTRATDQAEAEPSQDAVASSDSAMTATAAAHAMAELPDANAQAVAAAPVFQDAHPRDTIDGSDSQAQETASGALNVASSASAEFNEASSADPNPRQDPQKDQEQAAIATEHTSDPSAARPSITVDSSDAQQQPAAPSVDDDRASVVVTEPDIASGSVLLQELRRLDRAHSQPSPDTSASAPVSSASRPKMTMADRMKSLLKDLASITNRRSSYETLQQLKPLRAGKATPRTIPDLVERWQDPANMIPWTCLQDLYPRIFHPRAETHMHLSMHELMNKVASTRSVQHLAQKIPERVIARALMEFPRIPHMLECWSKEKEGYFASRQLPQPTDTVPEFRFADAAPAPRPGSARSAVDARASAPPSSTLDEAREAKPVPVARDMDGQTTQAVPMAQSHSNPPPHTSVAGQSVDPSTLQVPQHNARPSVLQPIAPMPGQSLAPPVGGVATVAPAPAALSSVAATMLATHARRTLQGPQTSARSAGPGRPVYILPSPEAQNQSTRTMQPPAVPAQQAQPVHATRPMAGPAFATTGPTMQPSRDMNQFLRQQQQIASQARARQQAATDMRRATEAVFAGLVGDCVSFAEHVLGSRVPSEVAERPYFSEADLTHVVDYVVKVYELEVEAERAAGRRNAAAEEKYAKIMVVKQAAEDVMRTTKILMGVRVC